ncbi:MAG: CAP domain-containing protein [Spirochaetes bacterium]|nr:CAP domain-containing protein [Spirochaetota bacterium]
MRKNPRFLCRLLAACVVFVHSGAFLSTADTQAVRNVPATASSSAWNDEMYKSYTAKDFESYGPAGWIIEFDRIDYPLLNAALFYETNKRRAEQGQKPFVHSLALEKASSLHSRDMVEKGFLSHENPYDRKKETPWQRMALYGVARGHRAENITEAFGIRYRPGTPVVVPDEGGEFVEYSSGKAIPPHTYKSFAVSVLDGWMGSPPHRANILDVDLLYLGCGAYHYRNSDFYGMDQFKATQCFASQVPQ